MIQINEEYRIVGKDLNLTVESYKENIDPESGKCISTKWQTIGYFSDFDEIISFFKRYEYLNDEELELLNSITQKYIDFISDVYKLEFDQEPNTKVIVNDEYFITVFDTFCKVVKKEQIRESAFTKAENVGKDKFIDKGFLPTIQMALVTILREMFIDFTSKEEANDLNSLSDLMDSLTEDIENITIVECSETEKDNLDNLDSDTDTEI